MSQDTTYNERHRKPPAVLAQAALLGIGVGSFVGSGSTVALGLIALFGIASLLTRDAEFTPIERTTAKVMAGLYALLLGVDFINGGGPGNLERTGLNYLPFLLVAPCSVGVRLANPDRALIGRAVMASIVVAAVYSIARITSLAQVGWDLRVGGVNTSPGPFAFAILTWALLLMHFTFAQGRVMARAVALTALAYFAIILTGSKSALISAYVGAGLVGPSWVRTMKPPGHHVVIFGAFCALALCASYVFLEATGRIDELFLELNRFVLEGKTAGNSAGPRIAQWIAGLRAFAEAPVIGHGLQEAIAAADATQPEGALNLLQYSHLHNDYLQHMVAYGIFGLVFLGLFFWYSLWLAGTVTDPALRGFAVSFFVVLLVYMLAEVAFNMGPVSGLMALVLGLILAYSSGGGIALLSADGAPSASGRRRSNSKDWHQR